MKNSISRRDVLTGRRRRSRRRSILDPRDGRCAAAGSRSRRPDRRGEEGRPGHLLHLDRSAGRGEAGQGVRGEISGHRGARRAHRRGARVPAHRPGIFQQHPCRRCREFVRCRAFHRLEARRHSGALRAGGRREILSGRAQGPRRPVRELPRLAQHHRLQHQPGEGGGRAEEFCRSARSQMEGQDRQGASGLQRHHHDRDLSDAARSRLELLRAACQAEHHAGAVVGRSAEEARSRRARGHGRRQRVQHLPDEGGRPSGRAGLRHRRLAADHRTERHLQGRRPIRTRQSCSSRSVSAARPSSSSSMSAACARCIRRPRRRRAASRSRTSRP